MLKILTLAAVLLMGLHVCAETTSPQPTAPRYLQCREKDADAVLTISLRYPGLKAARQEKVFVRKDDPEDSGAYVSIARMESGCGPSVGGTYSFLPSVGEASVEVTISRSSRTATARSSSELTISIPIFADQKDKIDGIAYTAAWTNMKSRKPNQSLHGTPGKVPSSSTEPEARRP